MKIDLFMVKKIGNFWVQNCVTFVLFKVLSYIWYQNNQEFDHFS